MNNVSQLHKCQMLKVDNWKEVELRNEETGVDEIEEVHIG